MTDNLKTAFSKPAAYRGSDEDYERDVWATVNKLKLDPHTGIDDGVGRIIVTANLRVEDVRSALELKFSK